MSNIDTLNKLLTPKTNKYMVCKPTPKQTAFLLMNDVKEILYGGAAGGGKSVAQLMGALQFVDVPGYSAILFRRTFADLSLPGALIDMSKDWLSPYLKSGEIKWRDKEKTYVFPSGATLGFGYLESNNDKYRYQGAEFHYIGMDECTHIPPSTYRYLFSRLRKTTDLDVPLRFRSTANPGGIYGDFYYERFFVEKGKRIFIPAGLDDNPHLDKDSYIESLEELDPIEKEQLLNGNWEVRASGDLFDSEWFSEVSPLSVPSQAKEVRYWDLASTDPKKQKNKSRGGMRDPDSTVGFKLAYYQGLYWIKDIIRVQYTPKEVEDLIKSTAENDGYTCAIRMEEEPGSSGKVVTDHYKRNVLPFYNFDGVSSSGSKVDRARNASAASQAGKIMMVQNCRNKGKFYDEIKTFPYGAHDDIVDGFSGAFNHFKNLNLKVVVPKTLTKRGGSYWKNIG